MLVGPGVALVLLDSGDEKDKQGKTLAHSWTRKLQGGSLTEDCKGRRPLRVELVWAEGGDSWTGTWLAWQAGDGLPGWALAPAFACSSAGRVSSE